MTDNTTWWVSTKEFLPNTGERVLIITKFGHISDAMWTDLGMGGSPSFRPDGLKPDIDVKWWMTIPEDGWIDINERQPDIGQAVLTLGMYGEIFNGIWKIPAGASKPLFCPYIHEVHMWREIPQLPKDVTLKY